MFRVYQILTLLMLLVATTGLGCVNGQLPRINDRLELYYLLCPKVDHSAEQVRPASLGHVKE